LRGSKDSKKTKTGISREEMDRFVAQARRLGEERMKGYREQSLRIHPWVCARCGMEFTTRNLHLLTVHHKDHNHDNNPLDGSNWEHLCIYCHDNEHRRYLDHLEGETGRTMEETGKPVTHKPFEDLADLLKNKKR
jgi:hypothetical protein